MLKQGGPDGVHPTRSTTAKKLSSHNQAQRKRSLTISVITKMKCEQSQSNIKHSLRSCDRRKANAAESGTETGECDSEMECEQAAGQCSSQESDKPTEKGSESELQVNDVDATKKPQIAKRDRSLVSKWAKHAAMAKTRQANRETTHKDGLAMAPSPRKAPARSKASPVKAKGTKQKPAEPQQQRRKCTSSGTSIYCKVSCDFVLFPFRT